MARDNGFMFEWHGWASIVGSPSIDDGPEAEHLDAEAKQAIRELIDAHPARSNEVTDLRSANGELHLWLSGAHNHRVGDHPTALFAAIAAAAPGSYGVLYAIDFDRDNIWERWVMRRGQVTREVDDSLSPHIPVVEDRDDRYGL
jgi:hypothetical protein